MITRRNAYNKADCAKMYPNVLHKFMITFTANDKRQFVSPCDQFFFLYLSFGFPYATAQVATLTESISLTFILHSVDKTDELCRFVISSSPLPGGILRTNLMTSSWLAC